MTDIPVTKAPSMPKAKTLSPTLPHGRKLSDFKPLLPAEQKLLDAVAIGEICWLCDEKNPVRPEQKTKDNEIRATFIRFLALDGDDEVFVHETGIQVVGAFVSEELNLTNCKDVKALTINLTTFLKPVHLNNAQLTILDFKACAFPSLFAEGIKCNGLFNLSEIKTDGVIHLNNAVINHSLHFSKAVLISKINDYPFALTCENIRIAGNLLLNDNFTSHGEVNLINANIKGDFLGQDGKFNIINDPEYPLHSALNCDQIHVDKAVYLSQSFKSQGRVSFLSANIGGDFICSSANFNYEKDNTNDLPNEAINCEQITIGGSLVLTQKCKVEAPLNFAGATIGVGVYCQNSDFKSLDFTSAKIGGDVLLSNNFHAEGEVRFKNATIGGDFICEKNSSIDNAGKTALHCGGVQVGGNVLLRDSDDNAVKLDIKGGVNFMDARIGKGFECSYAEITHLVPEHEGSKIAKYALNLQGAQIGGVFSLRNSELYGSLCLLKTHVDTLNDKPNSWPQPAIIQKISRFAKIKNFLNSITHKTAITPPEKTITPRPDDEEGALQSVDSEEHSEQQGDTKPAPSLDAPQIEQAHYSVIDLDGFSYNQIAGNSPSDAKTRKDWLMRQRPAALWENFRPQPFEQISKILRNNGHEEAATQLYIDKYDHKQRVRISKASGLLSSLWSRLLSFFFFVFLGRATGYGKRPARVFGLLLFLWASAALWYHKAAEQDVFAPSHPLIFLKYDQKPDCRINWVHCIENANDDHNPEFQAYTVFSAPLYSLDVMLPILNLHQEGDWGPKIKSVKILGLTMPAASTWYVMWSQIILGWLGSFMLIAMLSGWMQKE